MIHAPRLRCSSVILIGVVIGLTARAVHAAPALSQEECVKLLAVIDDRQRNSGDYRSLVYLEQKEKDKTDIAREAVVYRRDGDGRLIILFTKPKGEAGKGYLRIEKNLWFYDPNVGKWERRTERERIGGTDSRRSDFDESRLAEEYIPEYEGAAKLGAYDAHVLNLKAKPDVDTAYPILKLWIDQKSGNVLKRQDFALSGRLMRTTYYPKWQKLFSESKKSEVWYPGEIRFYDEVEKANSTLVFIREVDLHPLPENIFTKAWLESRSR